MPDPIHVGRQRLATNITASEKSESAAASRQRSARIQQWLPFVIAVASAAIVYLRTPSAARGVIWAEDGRNFMVDHLVNGYGGVFEPYQGYLHVVPRLLAGVVVDLLAPEQVAHGMTVAAALVIGAVSGALVWYAAMATERIWIRALIGLVPALVPTGPLEMAGNLANLHWYFLLLGFWMFLAVPRNWVTSWIAAVAVLLMTLSEPQLLIALPLFIRNIRERRTWPIASAAVIGIGAQLVISAVFPRQLYTSGAKLDLSDIVIGYLFEPFAGSFWWDTTRVARRVELTGPWLIVLGFALVAAFVVLALVAGSRVSRWLIAGHILGSACIWAAALLLNPAESFQFSFDIAVFVDNFRTWRYVGVSSMLALAGLIVAADALLSRPRMKYLGFVAVAVVSASLLVNSAAIDPARVPRVGGANWPAEVDRAATECGRAPADDVQVNTFPRHWDVRVPCDWVAPPR